VIDGKKLKLYVNGILDSMILLEGHVTTNKDPFFLGGSPGNEKTCDL